MRPALTKAPPSTTFRLALANIETRGRVLTRVKRHGRILLLNEAKPRRRRVKRWPLWRSRFADTNAIVWKREGIVHVRTWRREILPARPRRWQDSQALLVWLLVDGVDVLLGNTHMPSKAWTMMPWRRPGWRTAAAELVAFVDDVAAEIAAERPDLDDLPIIVGGDFNRGKPDWTLDGFDRTVGLVTYGRRGRYDLLFTRGAVTATGARARKLGSPHRTVTATITINPKETP